MWGSTIGRERCPKVGSIMSVFGCMEVGGSKEMRKYNCSLSYLFKY